MSSIEASYRKFTPDIYGRHPRMTSIGQRPIMKCPKAIPTILLPLAPLAALLMLAPPATAAPYTSTDYQYLAALNHGSLCCPQQTDGPIWYETLVKAINTGHLVADAMKRTPTYLEFHVLRDFLYNSSQTPGFYSHPLTSGESSEIVVIAVHYYAGPAVECALMKAMGGAMGEAPFCTAPSRTPAAWRSSQTVSISANNESVRRHGYRVGSPMS